MNPFRKALLAGALAVPAITGGAIGIGILASNASAQTATTTASTAAPAASTDSTTTPAVQRDPSQGGHTANGITETLLTGDAATKATAAAQGAVPGGTIQRVENDSEGAVYEAHVVKADGSHVTVKMDASFGVTGVETGGGR